MELRDRWNRLLPDAQPLGEDLLARYAESHRHYHDQRHLTEVLDTIDELADLAASPYTVRLAAWFHDAIYDPKADPGENEEVSAQLAELELSAYGVAADDVAEVGRLIRLTASHECESGDADGAVLCDADLRVLSLPASRYDQYAVGIRREYEHVGDRDFARGRTTFLGRLSTSSLYATDRGRQWEQAARDNLDRELRRLAPRAAYPLAGMIPLIYLSAALGAVVAASVMLGRALGAAPRWPAAPEQVSDFPVWAPIAGTALAAALTCAWFRRARPRVVLIPALVLVGVSAAALGVCWWRWPEARPGAALSERWPYLLLASLGILLGGGLLGLARRLRSVSPYSLAPPRSLSVGATLLCASLLTWLGVSAGEPFVQARLESANTISTTATSPPGVLPVQLDGRLAWSREAPAAGAIAGTAGGVAKVRSDGVVMSDATTGEVRWRYARADVDDAASDGSRGLLVSSDRRTLAAHLPYGGPGARGGIDLPTYAVLDAESGRVLTEVHTDGTALAIDGGRLLVAEGTDVVAHGVSSPTHWRARLKCAVTQGVLMQDQAIVVDACGGNGAVVRSLDLADGNQLWEVDLGIRFDLSAELDAQTWVGQLVAVPGTRLVSGLIWTGDSGGTLYQWSVNVGEGNLSWSAPVPGTPRPRLGPSSCDAQLAATRSSLVLVTCRSTTVPGENQQYDVVAVNPSDGTPQWHHLLPVPPQLQQPTFPRNGFDLLPDGRVVTLLPQADGSCAPVMVGTTGPQPRPLAAGPAAGIDTSDVTCERPAVTVAGGRPVFNDGSRLFALR